MVGNLGLRCSHERRQSRNVELDVSDQTSSMKARERVEDVGLEDCALRSTCNTAPGKRIALITCRTLTQWSVLSHEASFQLSDLDTPSSVTAAATITDLPAAPTPRRCCSCPIQSPSH